MEYDEGFFVWGGWAITRGLAPYRDFVEFKPPMVFLTHAFAQLLFGLKDHAYRHFFLLCPLSGTLALILALRSRGVSRWIALTLICALVVLFVNPGFHDCSLADSESIGLAYFIWGLALFLWDSRFVHLTDGLAAAFMCACVLSKEPFGPEVGLTWVCLFLLRGGFARDGKSTAGWPMVRSTAVGAGAFFAVLLAYLAPTGAFSAYLQMASRYARLYRDPTQSYCAMLGRFQPTTPWNDAWKQLAWMRADFVNGANLAFLLPLALLGMTAIARRSRWLLAAAVLTLLSAFWSVTASNCQWLHYYNMIDGGLFAVLAIGCVVAVPELARLPRTARLGSVALVVGVAGAVVLPRFLEVVRPLRFDQNDHEPLPGIVAAIDALSRPDERIFTVGQPYLYVQADRLHAVRYSMYDDEILGVYPGATDEEKLRPLYDELVRSRPAVVFLDPEHPHRKKRTLKALVMPFLENEHYVRVSEYLYRRP